ncbi:deoxyhypusine synthase [Candidatus Pacearchaeota archaeon]|nr:MAG: deoxyhypusine synthase [Candidatus Pacearchaeota archaeon]
MPIDKEKIARENILRESEEAIGKSVRGYDFDNGVDFDEIVKSFETTGAQATNLYKAIEIIREMRREKATIYLGYTSNMVTGGLREVFRFLAKHKMVDVMVTTAGGIEEDIIKCLGDFKIGDFFLEGRKLREKGINRAGNILIPNSRYCRFEEFIIPILEKEYQKQKKEGKILSARKLIWLLGEKINNKDSIYFWANKNKIPVFCPAITDGSLGDMIYFFKSRHPDFILDVSEDIVEMNNSTIGREKTGLIILGGGVVKHHICNANMFRNGADFAVYINNAEEHDGSDAGARPDEAVSWGKIRPDAKTVKVFGDASIIFPIVVSQTFAHNFNSSDAPE